MNNLKFFVFQVVLSFSGVAVDILFREFLYQSPLFSNRFIPALIETPINIIIMYFMLKLYLSLIATKLRYKIIIHIAAFIVGAIFAGLMGSLMGF